MKKSIAFLMMLSIAFSGWGQRSPQHPLDIPEGNINLYDILDAWEAGTPPPGTDEFDDQFYISRVRPLPRIVDGDYQVNSTLDPLRKLCMWVPLDDPSTKWKALPRYSFEGDNFGMWSYTDIHGNWTAPWMRVSAGLTDVAHKNGVKVGCVLSIPWMASVSASNFGSDYNKLFYRLFQKNGDGTFKYTMKLVQLMKYYGIDGLGCNSEFRTNSAFMQTLMAFSQDCHTKAEEIDWGFQLHWYDGTSDDGQIRFDQGLGNQNKGIFGTGDAIVTDMLFANYNWNNSVLANSVTKAAELNRSSYDYYAGMDIQGRAFKSDWNALSNNAISIGFWGAHAQSLLHQSATDDGTSDIAIQKAYLMKQELAFSGGNRNPELNPAIRNTATLANSDLKTFHGLSALLTAKSTIQQVPFVTRFSLGNGLFFNDKGETTFNSKWHNINTQDFLPTWRWWITDSNDEVNTANLSGLINADFTFDDAWFGGSCLKIHGESAFSRVKLFKTKLEVQPQHTISVTYKVLNGTDPKAKVFIAKAGQLSDYKEYALPQAVKGEWTTVDIALSDVQVAANDVISMIGVSFENTTSDYELLLGEIAVRNPSESFTTVAPTIKKVDMLRGRYNEVDFKIYYQSKVETGGEKTYNDEVDTWYYEIYFQQEGAAEQLITATTSWAGYVIGAPMIPGGSRNARYGVRAVSPDGKGGSAITWTAYEEVAYNNPLETVVANKPVIKPAEEFTLRFEDTMHAPAQKWEIKDPLTGAVLATAVNSVEITTSIANVGLYDLYITNDLGNTIITRGFVQITPEATGAVPQINTFGANKTEAETLEEVIYSYTSRDGEGAVSRSLRVEDPKMFMVPGSVQTGLVYSYAVWFKAEKFSHDKQGTNLINKNSIDDSWPHNNWGDLWVTIRPEWKGTTTHPENEVSFNTYGWTAHDSPREEMMSTGFSVTPGVWYHVVVTQDAAKNQKMYFNGKMVASSAFSSSNRRENTDIFIGGGGVYKAGFNGWIDEVQVWNKPLTDAEVLESMQGYETAPAGLVAYYTFEDIETDNTFANQGNGGDVKGKVVILEGSGGESTGGAEYVTVAPENDELGYPGIVGSLNITTEPQWRLAEATVGTPADKAVTVTYTKGGIFDAGLTIENMWGKDAKDMVEYITISGTVGMDDADGINMLSVYPNPFVESVNMLFPEAGDYTVLVNNAAGQRVSTSALSVNASEVVNVAINGNKGFYLLQILKDGKTYKSIKIIKK